MQSVRNELKWADGKAVKNEMDLMVGCLQFSTYLSLVQYIIYFLFFSKKGYELTWTQN